MHAAIAVHQKEIIELCRRYGVTKLEAFGSAARGADFDPANSDADFLVVFDRNTNQSALGQYFGFADALSTLLSRPVDLLESGAIVNPYIRASVDRDREVVYAA